MGLIQQLCACFMIIATVCCSNVKILDDVTCIAKENPVTYEIDQLDCMFRGMGLYKYDGPGSVSILTMDRLTDDSFLNVPPTSTLRKILIQNGNTETCDLVKAPHHISVYVNGKMCVSTCNSVKPNLRTHPPPTPNKPVKTVNRM